MNLTAILDQITGLPQPLRRAAAWTLGFAEADRLYGELLHSGSAPLSKKLLDHFAVTCRAAQQDLKNIPRTGPAVIVANHPCGILDGAVLAALLGEIRPDVKILANEMLAAVPELSEAMIFVDPISGTSAARRNAAGLRKALEFLEGGGCLVVFPAGEVSHLQRRRLRIEDSDWNTAIVRMIAALDRRGVAANVVPVYIRGTNSRLFHALGLLHPKLRTMLLARELMNKRNAAVEVRAGSAIAGKKLLEIPTAAERTRYLRWRTYLLEKRENYKPRTALPFARRNRQVQVCIAQAEDPAEMQAEIALLRPDALLAHMGDLDVYVTRAERVASIMREIGRLREITFRAAGEGTGKSRDLDRFDAEYLHLFLWNAAKREVAGAYRVAGTDIITDLYTATLFKYDRRFLTRMGPALELGRSFVRAEYQRGFAPLLALWKGIGAYVARHPRYRVLFGPVSISNQYQAISRELMVAFLERQASLREWAGLIAGRLPFRSSGAGASLPKAGIDAEDLSRIITDLEPSRAGIPVLLRQYLKLGGKLLGFNVDPEFSNALDGLILVDLDKTERNLLERYLGKAEAAEFLKHRKRTQ